jgi:hypothetical protein
MTATNYTTITIYEPRDESIWILCSPDLIEEVIHTDIIYMLDPDPIPTTAPRIIKLKPFGSDASQPQPLPPLNNSARHPHTPIPSDRTRSTLSPPIPTHFPRSQQPNHNITLDSRIKINLFISQPEILSILCPPPQTVKTEHTSTSKSSSILMLKLSFIGL